MKLSRRLIATLAALSLIVTLFAGCSGNKPSQPATSGGASGGAEETIKIGYVSALSGDTALWGQAGLNGMQLVAEEINAAGGVLGKKIEVIGLDGMGQPMDSVNAYNKLVDEYKVVAVVGTNFSSCNIPMAPVADQKKVPLIATAASSELVTVDEKGNLHPYSFRIGFIDPFQGQVLARYVAKELGIKKAAIIYDIGDSYSSGVASVIKQVYEMEGGTMVAEEQVRSGDNDFRAQLTSIAKSNPEVLFIPMIYKDVALIATQAKELGINALMIGADGWDSKELPTMAGGALEGAYFCSRPGFNTPEAKAFGEKYVEKFKIDLEAECLFGHDGLKWLVQVIEEKGSYAPEDIRDGLENTTSFKGLLGEMSVDPASHNPDRDAAIFKIVGENIEFVRLFK